MSKNESVIDLPVVLQDRHLLLWDGECGFCRRVVGWIRANDKDSHFRSVSYQDAPSPPMTDALRVACDRAVHVISRDGEVLKAGRAVLFVLRELGWRKSTWLLRLPPFIWGIEIGYWIVARNRRFFSRFLFRQEHCELPRDNG